MIDIKFIWIENNCNFLFVIYADDKNRLYSHLREETEDGYLNAIFNWSIFYLKILIDTISE